VPTLSRRGSAWPTSCARRAARANCSPNSSPTSPSTSKPTNGSTAAEARSAEVAAFWLPVGRNEGRIVLHLAGSDSIESAEKLMGLDVLIPESERPELDDDTNYVSDLIGCTLYDLASGHEIAIGTVTDLQFPTTPDGARRLEEAAPVLEVEGLEGEEILIPFAKHFLLSVDVAAKKILMRLPDGLLEIYRAG
jgi:16S rRNA processing protein RimM